MSEKPPTGLDRDGRDSGWYAAMEGDIPALTARLDAGLNIDHADKGGATLLWIAAHHAQMEAVELLLERGAAVDAADSHGNAALWHATRQATSPVPEAKAHLAIVELLLSAGAEPNRENRHGMSAPGWAGPMVANGVNLDEVQTLYRAHHYIGDFA